MEDHIAFSRFIVGKGKERGGKLTGQSESSYLAMGSDLYNSTSLPIPSTLIRCCFCGLTDRSVSEKCHSVCGEIFGHNRSKSE